MDHRDLIARWRKRSVCVLLSGQIVAVMGPADAATPLDRDALGRCAAISADDRRLACYDALAGRAASPPTAGAPSPPSTGTSAASAAARTAPTASANPPKVDDEKLFGLNKPLEPVARGPETLRATIAAIAADFRGIVTVQLDNDQTWTFTDANALLRKGDSIVIKRAALGSFIMTTPTKRTYQVHRIK